YYVLTGFGINMADARALGIVAAVVDPAGVNQAIQDLIAAGKPDKYRSRTLPDKFLPIASMFSSENVTRLLSGKQPENAPPDLAAKVVKTLGFKAPIALRISNEIIDMQIGKSMPEAVEIELERLAEIFSTADALEGLGTAGRKRPEFKGA
ncbi:MAG: hypothetical protein WA151_03865, partial [Desulfatirhabdiaceae bacterium]